jgi:hypothetical protein
MKTIACLFVWTAALWAQIAPAVNRSHDEDHIVGKPYSATAVTHTVQTLANGSHIDRTATQLLSQDSQGRYRIETTGEHHQIVIADTVGHVTYNLNPESRTAIKLQNGGVHTDPAAEVSPIEEARERARSNPRLAVEDLGAQVVNGVMALGVRLTMTIPLGAIGNDQELKSVTDRWYSSDLQALVKSVTNDPRSGVNTYELTNIVRVEPDPTLFQVPPGYTITTPQPRQQQQ